MICCTSSGVFIPEHRALRGPLAGLGLVLTPRYARASPRSSGEAVAFHATGENPDEVVGRMPVSQGRELPRRDPRRGSQPGSRERRP
jgi:hypothetical protein